VIFGSGDRVRARVHARLMAACQQRQVVAYELALSGQAPQAVAALEYDWTACQRISVDGLDTDIGDYDPKLDV
jgi:hypothetical protein